MTTATIEQYVNAYDTIKSNADSRLCSNLFLSLPQLVELFNKKDCLFVRSKSAMFILEPRHNSYYNIFFVCANTDSLGLQIRELQAKYTLNKPLSVSLAGKEPETGQICEIFKSCDFRVIKKLLRMRLNRVDEKIINAMRSFGEDYNKYLEFAKPGDEQEIYDILASEFDPVGDQLPELVEIRERIDQENIAVIRKNGRILALQYFHLYPGILHSLYDVTLKEYRGSDGLFFALAIFVMEYLKAKNITSYRSLGWRDASRIKLLKHSKKSNQGWDGVVLYNMVWEPGNQ